MPFQAASFWGWRALAAGLLALGWQSGALAAYRQMLRLAPCDLHASSSAAHILGQMGRRREAIRILERALEVHASHATSWFDLAYLLESEGRLTESEPAFRSAVALDPAMDRACYGLALVLMREDRLEEAVLALEQTTRLQPLSPYGWFQLGKVHARRGDDDSVLKVIHHLRGFEPQVAGRLAQECGLGQLSASQP
jgi:tetratricopeptide (TPR) repeat protein